VKASSPSTPIVGRYAKSIANLSAAIALADCVYVYVNSVDDQEARLCVRTESSELRKVYDPLPTWVEDTLTSAHSVVQQRKPTDGDTEEEVAGAFAAHCRPSFSVSKLPPTAA
jgi:hypothetical protein